MYPLDHLKILEEEDVNEVTNEKSTFTCSSTAQQADEPTVVECGSCKNTIQLKRSKLKKEPLFGELSDENNKKHWINVQHCSFCSSIVGLALKGQVWTGEEWLRSSDTKSKGLTQVESYADRVVLYVLSQVFFQQEDVTQGEDQVTFLCPGPTEVGKVLWKDGEAAGFYTLKPKGSPYTSCSYVRYQMPVVDLVYVRRKFRRQGLASAIVADIMATYPNEDVGFSEPVSNAMLQVLAKFLEVQSDRRDQVWEVNWTGQEGFRNNIWLLIRRLKREKVLK